jgi:hypothetical protein
MLVGTRIIGSTMLSWTRAICVLLFLLLTADWNSLRAELRNVQKQDTLRVKLSISDGSQWMTGILATQCTSSVQIYSVIEVNQWMVQEVSSHKPCDPWAIQCLELFRGRIWHCCVFWRMRF